MPKSCGQIFGLTLQANGEARHRRNHRVPGTGLEPLATTLACDKSMQKLTENCETFRRHRLTGSMSCHLMAYDRTKRFRFGGTQFS